MATKRTQDADVAPYQNFSGLRNNVTPERFSVTDLSVAINIDLDTSGRLARRNGYVNQIAGNVHSLWSDEKQICLYRVADKLMQYLPTNTAVQLLAGLTPGQKMSYDTINDRVYFSDGISTGILDDGAVRTWGIVPPTLPTPASAAGNTPPGQYQFTMTYLRQDGQESGAPLAGVYAVNSTMTGIGFSGIPVSADPDVTRKAIYLTTPNGDILYRALLLPNNVTSAVYLNDTTELDLPLEMQFLCPAPAGQLVKYYRGGMYVAVGDTLYRSEDFAYELFDYRKYVQFDGRITMLAAIEDMEGRGSGFFVGTDKSCGVLVGSNMADFQYVSKVNYGAIKGALDYVDGSLFGDDSAGARLLPMFVTTAGICIGMPSMDIKNLTRTKYGFTATGEGAATFMPGPNRFVAVMNH